MGAPARALRGPYSPLGSMLRPRLDNDVAGETFAQIVMSAVAVWHVFRREAVLV
jgi:hypothetical protein